MPSLRFLSVLVALSVTPLSGAETSRDVQAPPRLVFLSSTLLDTYAGEYQYSESTVMHVARADDHLAIRFTGQPTAGAVYPQSRSTFFYLEMGSDAKIEFNATSAVLRQNGAATRMARIDADKARQIEEQVSKRVEQQAPHSLSEAALREFMASIMAGRIEANRLSPQLVGALGKDLPKLQLRLVTLGVPMTVRLKEVSPTGSDEYEVTHEHGVSEWGVVVDSQGVITGASVPF